MMSRIVTGKLRWLFDNTWRYEYGSWHIGSRESIRVLIFPLQGKGNSPALSSLPTEREWQ
jgi:hypothetical protein